MSCHFCDSPALGDAKTSKVSNEEEEETVEDIINQIMESSKMLTNASYFAFTATPKNKTMEIFGKPVPLTDHTELFKQFSDNPSFKKWLGDTIFGITYQSLGQASSAL